MIHIKDKTGKIRFSTPFNSGSILKKELMKEEYILLKFSVEQPVGFQRGDYADTEYGVFEIIDLTFPVFNTATGGYDYDLRLDASYWKWKNKKLFYDRQGNKEASWSLTRTPDAHLSVVVSNLSALGYKYGNAPYAFFIDSSVDMSAKSITYNEVNIIDALSQIAEAWESEWWVEDDIIHLGKCEYNTAVDFEFGGNVRSMSRSESNDNFATRIYAFGSTRNLPSGYRKGEHAVFEGVVQKRLMLPSGVDYVDAYEGMAQEEAVEAIVVFDDVYPRRIGTMSGITTKEYTDTVEHEGGSKSEEKWKAYRFRDTGLVFQEKYLIPGQELRITFTSGALNGMDFAVSFDPDKKSGKEEQLFEIIRNENYGISLPGGSLIPANGDTYILYGFDTSFVSDAMLPAAEQELLGRAREYVEKSKRDPSVYDCDMNMVSVSGSGLDLNVGDRVNLIHPTYFRGGRQSRIYGFQKSLDGSQVSYMVGDTARYSRLAQVEGQVKEIVYQDNVFSGSGNGVYVIGRNDVTGATDRNVYSALRILDEISGRAISKLDDDSTKGVIAFLNGLLIGDGNMGITKEGIARFAKALTSDLDVSTAATLFSAVIKKYISSEQFIPGLLGEGFKIYQTVSGDWTLDIDQITVRKMMTVFELLISKIRAVNGGLVISPANGKVKSVSQSGNYYELGMEGDMTFVTGDLVRCQVAKSGNSRSYWVEVKQIKENCIFCLVSDFNDVVPEVGDDLVQFGNTKNVARQGIIYLTASEDGKPRVQILDKVNSTNLNGKNKVVLGCLDGITDAEFPADHQPSGYGLYANNVFLRGNFILKSGKTVEEVAQDKANEAVNNIQIGGKNLILNSKLDNLLYGDFGGCTLKPVADRFGTVTEIKRTYGTGEYQVIFSRKIPLNTTITLSVKYKDINNGWFQIGDHQVNGAPDYAMLSPNHYSGKTDLGDGWVLLWATFVYNGTSTFGINTCLGTIRLCHVKAEVGKIVTDWTPAPEDVEEELKKTQQAASAAKDTAESATNRLNNWASDSVISPVEKTSLKLQQDNIQSEYQEIASQVSKYSLTSSSEWSAYYSVYISAIAALVKYTRATPENISIELDYSAISAYYPKRQLILERIATATKLYAETLVDGIQIGGRNLLLNTDRIYPTNGKEYTGIDVPTDILNVGETYTWSFDLKVEGNFPPSFTLIYHQRWGGHEVCGIFQKNIDGTQDWNRYSVSFVYPGPLNGDTSPIQMSFYCGYGTGSFPRVKNPKLEKGNKATDWTPAPEDVDAAINNIQIGGRNLILNSKEERSNLESVSGGGGHIRFDTVLSPNNLKVGELYYLSFEARGSFDGELLTYGNNFNTYFNGHSTNITTEWKRYCIQKEITQVQTHNLFCEFWGRNVNLGIYIRNVKLEKGNKATDWTPAPEDVEADINSRVTKSVYDTYIQATDTAIEARVKQVDFNALGKRVGETESKIDQLPDAITMSVMSSVKIGGRNIAQNTKRHEAAWWWVGPPMPLTVDLKSGDKVQISWYVNKEQASTFALYIAPSWGDDSNRVYICHTGYYTGKRASFVWTVPRDYPKGSVFNLGGVPELLTSVSELMFELDVTNPSNWMPAPEDTETAIDNIQVGGRNLYVNSQTEITYWYGVGFNGKQNNGFFITGPQEGNGIIRINNVIKDNGWYTFSGFVKSNSSGSLRIDFCDRHAGLMYYDTVENYFEFTLCVENYTSDIYNFIDIEGIPWVYLWFRDIKVERGNKATDWTPAPEDVNAEIKLRPTVKEIKSSFTMTPGGISLLGQNIDMTGKVTFSSLDTAAQNTINNKVGSDDVAQKLGYSSYSELTSKAESGQTIINGGYIRTGLINADELITNNLLAEKIQTTDIKTGRLTVSDGANIGNWSIEGGRIVSELNADNKISLDARYPQITVVSSNSGGDYSLDYRQGSKITMNASNGIVEARSTKNTSRVSYISPTGIFANNAETLAVSATLGITRKASIVGLGYGNVDKSQWDNENFIAGIYGTASNSGTAPAYGGFFQNLLVAGLFLKMRAVNESPSAVYLVESDSLVVGYSRNQQIVYLPNDAVIGRTIFVKQWWSGYMRFYPRSGQSIWDDSSENAYYDFGEGWGGIFTFVVGYVSGVKKEAWLVSRWKY